MPKPFKRRPDQKVHLGPAAPLMRPAAALQIANIASHWSQLEQNIALPYVYLLGGQEESAFEAYHELFEINLRYKMFVAVAKRKKITNDLLQEAGTLHNKVRKAAGQRNRVVHGLWAVCDELPESILLADPHGMNRRIDEFFRQMHDEIDVIQATKSWSFDMNLDEYDEYRHNDFEEITKRIIELIGQANDFSTKVLSFSIQAVRERRGKRRSP